MQNRLASQLRTKEALLKKDVWRNGLFSKGKNVYEIVKDDLMVRTGPEMYGKAMSKPHSRPMDFTGKPMRGFVYVESQGYKTSKSLSGWVNLGLDYDSKLK